MAIDPISAHAVSMQSVDKKALKAGYPLTCSSCEFLHTSQKTSADDCGRLLTCGGPIFGRHFPDYKGPLTAQILERVCLICGDDTVDYHVLAGLRRFGLCLKHKSVFNKSFGPGSQVPIVVKIAERLF